MVPPLPALPAAARRRDRPTARADGGGRALPLHARRPARDPRRLPRGAARSRAADPTAGGRGPARDRPVAGADGRVPRLRRDHPPQPRVRPAAGPGARRSDGGRLPAGHVRTRRADAADPEAGRDRAGGRLARGAGGRRLAHLPVGIAGRLVGAGRVPAARVRQRRVPPRRAGSAVQPPGSGPRVASRLLRRRPGPGDVRDRPHGAVAPARRPNRGEPSRRRGLDATRLLPERQRTARKHSLPRRASVERTSEHADGDALSPARPEGCDGPRRAGTRPLCRAVPGALRQGVAGATPRSRLAEGDRELRARLDLRLLRRRGLDSGPRPLRRGRADRDGSRRRGYPARGSQGAAWIRRHVQSVALPTLGRRRARTSAYRPDGRTSLSSFPTGLA